MFVRGSRSFRYAVFAALGLFVLFMMTIAYFNRGSNQPRTIMTPQNDRQESRCRIQHVTAGDYFKYNTRWVQSWVQYADKSCLYEVIRDDHPLMTEIISEAERKAFKNMSSMPVVQADFMKFLSMYYLGGLVVDFDIEALKPYPSAWQSGKLEGCDVIISVEHDVFEGDLKPANFARHGQIQTWGLYSRVPGSPFLRVYIDAIVHRLKPFWKGMSAQDPAGSGMLTDVVIEQFGNHLKLEDGILTKDKSAVVKLPYSKFGRNETVCIAGLAYTGHCDDNNCLIRHHFEGTWK